MSGIDTRSSDDATYRRRFGANFRNILSDLKRNVNVASRELGLDAGTLERMLAGDEPVPGTLVEAATRIWPVNERDFHPIHDDLSQGAVIMRASESRASARILDRAGAAYYEYRDTAMSHVGTIRPEWIRMLHHVEDSEPGNPTVQWNEGHFLFQFTYFVGEVNYYYEWNGREFCAEMNTGDSVFGLPWAPHSFASRNPKGQGTALILALTFGARLLGDPQQELGALGRRRAVLFAEETRRGEEVSLLRHAFENGARSVAQVATEIGVSIERLESLLDGKEGATTRELDALAGCLEVSRRELMPLEIDTSEGVRIRRHRDAPAWRVPEDGVGNTRVRALACSRLAPWARGLEAEIFPGAAASSLRTGLHEFGYVLGGSDVELSWEVDGETRTTRLEPDDSFHLAPYAEHRFSVTGDSPAKVLLLRAAGRTAGDALLEAGAIGTSGVARIVDERSFWYDPAGRTSRGGRR